MLLACNVGIILFPLHKRRRLLESDARFARELVASLCERLEALVADFEATTHGARGRLASWWHRTST